MNTKKRLPTISDVAKAAGVSMAAVSRVASGDKTFVIRDETRERITEAARKLNYQPSPVARGLRKSRTFSLGIVVPELDNPVHARIIMGAERAAAERGYSLLIAHRGIGMSEIEIYERLAQRNRVDGLIVATLQDEKLAVPALKKLDNPFVLVNRKARGSKHYMVIDDRGGSRLAVDFLVSLGHRRIAHLSGEPHRYNSKCRLQGYKDGLLEAGIPFDEQLVAEAGYTQSGGATAARQVLEKCVPPPTAIFATTLMVAAGAMSALWNEGIRVPDEISVIGFNDGAVAEVLAPPLTTIRTPLDEMGYEAASSLIQHLEGEGKFVGRTLPGAEIVERSSTGPAPQNPPPKARVGG